jgi:hypothetical protein
MCEIVHQRIDVLVGVGEREWARRKFGFPAGDHVRLEGMVFSLEDV